MAFEALDSPDQRAVFFLCIFMTPPCILLTTLRFTPGVRSGRKIDLSDWLALVAFVIYLAWVGYGFANCIIVSNKNVLMPGAIDKAKAVAIVKTGYVLNIFFAVQQTCAKLSILILYYRVFSVTTAFRYMIYGVGTLQILWFIPMFVERIVVCTPPAKLWNQSLPGHCTNSQIFVAAGESINSFIDFVMIGMAIYMISKIEISRTKKVQLSVIFAIGGLSGVVGLIKIGMVYGKVDKTGTDLAWLILQTSTSCMCCCVPVVRSRLSELRVFTSLRSTLSSLGSSKSVQSSNKGGSSMEEIPSQRKTSKASSRQLHERPSTRNVAADGKSTKSGGSETPNFPAQTAEMC